jgi:hypothetical protein
MAPEFAAIQPGMSVSKFLEVLPGSGHQFAVHHDESAYRCFRHREHLFLFKEGAMEKILGMPYKAFSVSPWKKDLAWSQRLIRDLVEEPGIESCKYATDARSFHRTNNAAEPFALLPAIFADPMFLPKARSIQRYADEQRARYDSHNLQLLMTAVDVKKKVGGHWHSETLAESREVRYYGPGEKGIYHYKGRAWFGEFLWIAVVYQHGEAVQILGMSFVPQAEAVTVLDSIRSRE